MRKYILTVIVIVCLLSLTPRLLVTTHAYSDPMVLNFHFSWTDCLGHNHVSHSDSQNDLILTISSTPASYTTIAWNVDPSTSEGVPPFLCGPVNFTGFQGNMFDHAGWTATLDYNKGGAIGSFKSPILLSNGACCRTINYGDTFSISFSLQYGVWFSKTVAITCNNAGSPYSNCFPLSPYYNAG